jgi:TRAP transporter TAXI family solute receptor
LKVNFNTRDSFMEIVGREVLASYGISYDDLKKWGGNVDFMSMGASLDLMRDGKIQAYSNVIQVPSSHVVDVSTNLGLTLFGMSEAAQKAVNEKLGTYSTSISKDAYNFLTADVPTVGATVVLFTNADLSDEAAYAVVKAIDENFEYFKSIHSSLKDLELEALHDVAPALLHPGAEKYFAEKSSK